MGQAGACGLALTRGDLVGKACRGFTDRLGIEQDQRCCRSIVEDRFQAGMQERLKVLDSLEVDCIAQVFQDQAPPVGRDVQGVAALLQPGRNIGQDLVRQEQFPGREQHQLVHRLERALGEGVEGAHGLHRVAEKLDPDRCVQVGREDVQDAAPDGKAAAVLHQGNAGIAEPDQPGQKLLPLEFLAGHQIAGNLVEERAGQDPLHGRRHRQHHHPRLIAVHAGERIEPRTGDVGMGGCGRKRGAVPGREGERRRVAAEKGQFTAEFVGSHPGRR